ncbi:MAG: aminotransferase class V-fold PLP-dependent enzyme, partial [Pseudomonadota bacterium]
MTAPLITTVPAFDVADVRADFPILSIDVYGKPLVYLDNAASAQKPRCVIDAMTDAMATSYANVHRGLHYLSNEATAAYERARSVARKFVHADDEREIILTGGATDAINLVAECFVRDRIEPGDEIILSELEHHSNIVPWHYLRQEKGAVLKWLPVTDTGEIDLDAYRDLFSTRTKFVALSHMSNALGTILPAADLVKIAHDHGIPILLDGCQAAVHLPLNVATLDCDFYAFSGHKLYGPTGIGCLYGKLEHLEAMRPYRGGGEMISLVTKDEVEYA